jgi:guanine nucleotide-binding protein G(i) subunit alpha
MHESLKLFEETINSSWFERTPVILFLNKIDLFEKKIATKDLKCCFPNYEDGCNLDKAQKYILAKFLEKNRGDTRAVYSHFTCATSTENIIVVFKAVQAIFMADVVEDILI